MRTRLRYVRFFFVSSHKGFRTWNRYVRMYTSVHFFFGSRTVACTTKTPRTASVSYIRSRYVRMYTSFLVPVHFFLENGSLLSRLAVCGGPGAAATTHGQAGVPQLAIVVQYAVASCALWLTGTPPAFIVHRTRRDTSPLAAARLRSHWTRRASSPFTTPDTPSARRRCAADRRRCPAW